MRAFRCNPSRKIRERQLLPMSDDYALLQYRYIRSSNLGTMEKQLDRYLYHFEVLTRQGSLVADVTFKRLDDLDEFAGSFMGCFTDLDAL